jgi:hypothetical protein
MGIFGGMGRRDRRPSLFLRDRLTITGVYRKCLVSGNNQGRGS